MQHALLIALVCAILGAGYGMLAPAFRTVIQRATAELTGDRSHLTGQATGQVTGPVTAAARERTILERPSEPIREIRPGPGLRGAPGSPPPIDGARTSVVE